MQWRTRLDDAKSCRVSKLAWIQAAKARDEFVCSLGIDSV